MLETGIILLDNSRHIQHWNAWMARSSGLTPDSVIGETVDEILCENSRLDQAIEEALVFGVPSLITASLHGHIFPLRCPDGRALYHNVLVSRFEDQTGLFCLIQVQDTTARRTAETVLRHSKEEAEKANRAKSKFLAAASHDLRQPVQSLFFLLSALESSVKPGATKTLVHATQSLMALKFLLDSLLDISQLDAGVIEPAFQEFPVSALFDQLDAEYKPIAEAKGLGWHVTASNATVRSDSALLGRMLRNLCQNAIRYTETGSVLLTWRSDGDTLRIKVQDTGIGISADTQETIFEEFHQVGNLHRDRTQGLGLGLAIVRRLSILLEHPVKVRSTLGEGSTFSITVPMTRAPTSRRDEALIVPIALGDGGLVIVIDDDEMVRLGITALLESWGYNILDTASGPQALVALQGRRRAPDLIVSDYRLSKEKNGIDAIRAIRSLFGEKIPAILLTGETTRECSAEAAVKDITVVHKPISPSQLNAAVQAKVPVADGKVPSASRGS